MAIDDCPLLEVATALSPFIKSRDEAAGIRRELQNYLQSELKSNEKHLSSINLTSPDIRTPEAPAGNLTGVRKAYWKALQSHTQAQEKYDALKAELDQIKHSKNTNATSESTSLPNDGYMILLRQREKHRKLMVIDRALSKIGSGDGSSSSNNLDDMIKAKSGEAPTPPSNQPSLNRNPEVDAKLMELKKAIVSTKRKAEEQRARISPPPQPTDESGRPTSQGEVAGLQNALQVLTVWMEDQLTLIASTEADVKSPNDEPTTNGIHEEPQVSMTSIERLYEQYLETRQRLIDTVNDDATPEPRANGFSFDTEISGGRGLDFRAPNKSSAEVLLPFMPALIAAKQEEQALLQQSSHNRRQMAVSEDEMANVIRRFAGESHLVQPDANKGHDWTTAATEAGAATEKIIKDRFIAGEQAAAKANDTLHSVQGLPESLQNLAG